MSYLPKPRPHLIERAVQALHAGSGAAEGHPGPHAAAAARALPHAAAGSPEPSTSATPAPLIDLAALRHAGLLVGVAEAGRSRLSEELNVIHHQVLRTLRKAEPVEGHCHRAVLVTSARPGEGKSFTALNLAASIAAGGLQPAVLVDADGKRGSLSDLLGVADAPGLRLLATAPQARPAALPLRSAQAGLSVLPYGCAGPDATTAPPGTVLARAIHRLAQALPDHLFVIDSPPCLATSDPSSLAAMAGQVLMVVQAERTQRAEVESALDQVEACPVLQLLLNRTRLTSGDGFGSQGYDTQHAYAYAPGPRR